MFNQKTYQANYYNTNKESIDKKHRDYHFLHRDELKKKKKNYRGRLEVIEKNRLKFLSKKKLNLDSWRGLIPDKTNCQVCGVEIYFGKNNRFNAIHFDHKTGNEAITKCPTTWLGFNPRTQENEKIFISCNFGMLCRICNQFLPTKNRVEWLKKVYVYVGGIT